MNNKVIHSGECVCFCNVCNKSFTRQHYLKTHQHIHADWRVSVFCRWLHSFIRQGGFLIFLCYLKVHERLNVEYFHYTYDGGSKLLSNVYCEDTKTYMLGSAHRFMTCINPGTCQSQFRYIYLFLGSGIPQNYFLCKNLRYEKRIRNVFTRIRDCLIFVFYTVTWHMEEWRYRSTFLDLTRWKWVVSFMPLLL
jgi:hypothetical protein